MKKRLRAGAMTGSTKRAADQGRPVVTPCGEDHDEETAGNASKTAITPRYRFVNGKRNLHTDSMGTRLGGTTAKRDRSSRTGRSAAPCHHCDAEHGVEN